MDRICPDEVARERLTAILDSIDCAVIMVDDQDVVRFANARALALLATDFDKVRGAPFQKLLRECLVPRLKNPQPLFDWLEMVEAVLDFCTDVPPSITECELEYQNGEDLILVLHGYPVKNQRGETFGKIAVMYDITSQRRAEKTLEAVSDAAREMNSDLQISRMLAHLFKVVKERSKVDEMAILWITDGNKGTVLGAIPDGFLGGSGAEIDLFPASDSIQGILVDIVSDVEQILRQTGRSLEVPGSVIPKTVLDEAYRAGARSLIVLPLNVFGRVAGLWVLASNEPRSYSHSDMPFLEPISEHLAVAINNAVLLQRTREMYSAAVRALAATVDIRDSYTMHHSEHVATIARLIATEMGLAKEEVEIIELAGLVHDIGKVGIPDAVLNKPGPLDPAERAVMTNHSVLGATILERAGMLSDLAPLVLHHHEWHNGSGYPARLKGDSIPTGSSILAVADAFDTMISDRVYRKGMSVEAARRELLRCAGGQFHPEVVKVFDSILERALQNDEAWLANILGHARTESRDEYLSRQPKTLVEQAAEVEKAITSKELTVLFRITQEIRKLLDLKELLDHILHIVAREMGYSNCVILLLDEEGKNLVISASLGMSEHLMGLKIPEGTGISWWVMKHGIPQNILDVTKDPRYYKGVEGVGSEVYIPLEVRGKKLGVLLVQKPEKGGFEANDVRLLMAVAGHIAAALEVAQLHEEVKRAADTDALTGLYNRRRFLAALDESIRKASTSAGPVPISVVIVDIDGLKQINDTYGHLAGDEIIKHFAECLSGGFRACDIVGRYGGDEFVVLLPGVSVEAATRRIKDVLSSWKKRRIPISETKSISVPGASFGVASYPDDGSEARVVLSVADNRLLLAKPLAHARAN
ncbi:MAG TPA: diguanylate cyclase [Firmicutes bacterium]|nr:diguanylate cyclase [Candidatus Fermentithermobacillaceae bacterium]